jgi:hypothetical protein
MAGLSGESRCDSADFSSECLFSVDSDPVQSPLWVALGVWLDMLSSAKN